MARKQAPAKPAKPRKCRKTLFTQARLKEICRRLADGEPLRQICRDDHMPAWRTVYDWSYERPEVAAAIARARDIGYDAIAEKTMEIITSRPPRVDGRIDSGYVQWQKAQVDHLLKLLAKWSPRYREKLDMGGDMNLTVNLKGFADGD